MPDSIFLLGIFNEGQTPLFKIYHLNLLAKNYLIFYELSVYTKYYKCSGMSTKLKHILKKYLLNRIRKGVCFPFENSPLGERPATTGRQNKVCQ